MCTAFPLPLFISRAACERRLWVVLARLGSSDASLKNLGILKNKGSENGAAFECPQHWNSACRRSMT